MVLVDASHPDMDPPPARGSGDAQTAQLAGERHDIPDVARSLRLTIGIWPTAVASAGNGEYKHGSASTRYRVTWGQ